MALPHETHLIKNFNLVDLESAFNQALGITESIYKQIETVESLYKTYFSQTYSPLPHDFTKHRKEDLQKRMRQVSWRYVISKMQIDNYISSKKRDELNELIEQDKLGPFNALTVSNFITDAAMNVNSLVDEAAKEVFEYVRPRTGHKTNEFSKGMPEKVIITGISSYQTWYKTISVGYHNEKKLKDLDNIFHLLDGKGPIQYPGDLLTKIKETAYNTINMTEYFEFKVFAGNGNLHLKFKRMDLANKLAQIATNNVLHS